MTAPVRESWASTASAYTGNLSVTMASGITEGDFLLIICCNDNTSATQAMAIYESGVPDTDWTKIAEYGGSGSDAHVAAFWKESDGADGSPTVYQGGSSYDCVAWCFRFSSVNMASPIYAYNGFDGAGDSFTMSALSTIVDDYGIAASSWDGGDCRPLTMTGSGWAELDEQGVDDAGTVAGNVGFNAAPGSTGANVTSSLAEGYAYIKIHIAPSIGPAIDNLSGVPSGDIVQISDVDVGDIDNMSGVTF